DVDADVRQARRVRVLEEDQVARLQRVAADRGAGAHLAPGAGADVLADHVLDHPVGEAGAVERVGTVGRPDVRVPDVAHGVVDDGVAGRGAATAVATTVTGGRGARAAALAERLARLDHVVAV